MKVFGIGMFKTGTTSLEEALGLLGLNHIKNPNFWQHNFLVRNQMDVLTGQDYDKFSDDENNILKSAMKEYDGFNDHPWMWYFKKAYEEYPNAKYILTVRKDDEALGNSQWNYYLSNNHKIENVPSKKEIIQRYTVHNSKVREFFKDKPNYIEMCFENGDGWSKLCKFLDKPIPIIDFPHANKGKI